MGNSEPDAEDRKSPTSPDAPKGDLGPWRSVGFGETLEQMMLYDFRPVAKPFEVLASRFWAPPAGVLSEAAVVAFHGDGRLEHASAREREDAVVLAVYWAGAAGLGLFDHLEGDHQLAALREGRSHLTRMARLGSEGGGRS
jgi:hypothetical protein